jgi:hypothetical protein
MTRSFWNALEMARHKRKDPPKRAISLISLKKLVAGVTIEPDFQVMSLAGVVTLLLMPARLLTAETLSALLSMRSALSPTPP